MVRKVDNEELQDQIKSLEDAVTNPGKQRPRQRIPKPEEVGLPSDVELDQIHAQLGLPNQVNAMDYARGDAKLYGVQDRDEDGNVISPRETQQVGTGQAPVKQRRKNPMLHPTEPVEEATASPQEYTFAAKSFAKEENKEQAERLAKEEEAKTPAKKKNSTSNKSKKKTSNKRKKQQPKKSNTNSGEMDANEIIRQNRKKQQQEANADDVMTPANRKEFEKTHPDISYSEKDPGLKDVKKKNHKDKNDAFYKDNKPEKALKDKNLDPSDPKDLKVSKTKSTDFKNADKDSLPYLSSDKETEELSKKTGVKIEKASLKDKIYQVPDIENREDDTLGAFDDLSNLNISLDSVEYVDSSDEDYDEIINDNLDYQLRTQPTHETVLNQSGYIAFMNSLTLTDFETIIGSTDDDYNAQKTRYEMFYRRMSNTNVGKITFDEFLDMTALNDIESLYAGLFFVTYPEPTKFDFTCQVCGKDVKNLPVPNSNLMVIHKTEALEQRNDIIKDVHDKADLDKYSTLTKTKKILLPKSKAIIEVKTPSLRTYLNMLFSMENQPDDEQAIQLLLFCDTISVIDLKFYKESGSVRYLKMSKLNDRYKFLKRLNIDDLRALTEVITSYAMRYAVEYGINQVECPHCQGVNNNISIDMESLVFQTTLRKLQE